jgi:hypothetical protein
MASSLVECVIEIEYKRILRGFRTPRLRHGIATRAVFAQAIAFLNRA